MPNQTRAIGATFRLPFGKRIQTSYNNHALAKSSVGFGDSNKQKAYTRQYIRLGVFLCLTKIYMAMCAGRPQGLPRPFASVRQPRVHCRPCLATSAAMVIKSLQKESQMTKKINGQSRPQFTYEQIKLIGAIGLAISHLESMLFLCLKTVSSLWWAVCGTLCPLPLGVVRQRAQPASLIGVGAVVLNTYLGGYHA